MSRFLEFEPTAAFPVAEQSVGNIVNLLRVLNANERLWRSHRLEISRDDKIMSEYLESMNSLRKTIGHYDRGDWGHDLGAIFGFELLKEQFQRQDLVLGQVDPSAIKTYFNELLIGDLDSDTAPTHLQLAESQPYILKGQVTPQHFEELQINESPDNLNLAVRSRMLFRDKSREKINTMWDNEKSLREGIPAFQNILGSQYLGFTYGLADFYWPHQIDQTIGPYAKVLDSLEF